MKLLLSLIILLLLLSSCSVNKFDKPVAKYGIIDLSNFDLINNGEINLDGEYEFYWNKLLTPTDFKTTNLTDNKDFIKVPRNWVYLQNSIIKPETFGFATYRLKVTGIKANTYLGLAVTRIDTAYKLWINDTLYLTNGVVADNKTDFKPSVKPEYIYFQSDSDILVITIQTANFFDKTAGITQNIRLGTYNTRVSEREKNIAIELFCFGILFIMTIYHLMMFSIRRKESINFYFSLFCFLFSLKTLFEGEKYFFNIFPSFPLELYYKLWFLTLTLNIPVALRYFKKLFPVDINKYIILTADIFFGIYSLLILFTPLIIYSQLINIYYISILISIIIIMILIIIAYFKKENEAFIVIIGFVMILVTGINDVLNGMLIINTGFYASFGFIGFVLTQSFLISYKFSKAFDKVDKLSYKLEYHQEVFEKTVEERTEELTTKNNTKEKLLTIISHDLKNSIQGIIMVGELLDKTVEKNTIEKNRDYIAKLNFEIKKMNSLLMNLMEWTSIQLNGITIKLETIELNKFVNSVISLYSFQASAKNITVLLFINDTIEIITDKNILNSILRNLLSNAIKFTNFNGIIQIRAIESNDNITIEVEDNGVGMSEDKAKRIFEIKFHNTTSGTKGEKGTGLGLSICKELSDIIGIDLQVESVVDKGTKFLLKLPYMK